MIDMEDKPTPELILEIAESRLLKGLRQLSRLYEIGTDANGKDYVIDHTVGLNTLRLIAKDYAHARPTTDTKTEVLIDQFAEYIRSQNK